MQQITLRPYQESIYYNVNDHLKRNINRIMVCAPTGSGKTILFAFIAKAKQANGDKILILTHRKELLFQAGGTFEKVGLTAHELTAKTRDIPSGDIVVAMIETLFKRVQDREEYEHFINQFDYIVIDEGHVGNFDKIFQYIPRNSAVIGFSATPYRKGQASSLDTFYNAIIQEVDVPDLIMQGFLAKPNTFGMQVDLSNVRITTSDYDSTDMHMEFERQRVYDGVIRNYKKHTPGQKAILFAASVESSQDMSARFNKEGILAAHVDAHTPDGERRQIFNLYKAGEIRILCNVGIATLGFDDPDTQVVILYRATKSLPLFLQMVGRGSRVTETKKEFTLLDFGNNCSQHGFWEQPREWQLANDVTRFRRESSMTKECPECERMVPLNTVTCECGYVWQTTRREQVEERIEADLLKLDGFQLQLYALGKTFEELEIIQNSKGYKPGWILFQLTSFEELKQYAAFKNYKPGWFFHAKKKFRPVTREQREIEIEEFKKARRKEREANYNHF